jgi:hypothetical protein
MNLLDVKVPPSPCLSCGDMNDMAKGTKPGTRPKPGDWSICYNCGHIMTFAADLTLRNPTDAEMIEIAGDKRLLLAQQAIANDKKKFKG